MAFSTTWDLSGLLPSLDEAHVEPAIEGIEKRVQAIEAWRDRLDDIEEPAQVAGLFDLLGELSEVSSRVMARGSLAFAADTGDERAQAFLARMENLDAEWDNRVRFLSLWWKGLDGDRAAALMPEDPELAHFARRLRDYAPYTLSEAEERIISIKDVTGASAIGKTREILASRFTFTSPESGEEVTLSELMRGAYHHDPDRRVATYDELWRVWSRHEAVLAHLYQTVVNDWYNEDITLRGFDRPIQPRNLANDVPDDAVETLLDVCRSRTDLFQDYFVWKGERLGLDGMSRYHIYAPLRTEEGPEVPYQEAAGTVLDVLSGFDADVGSAARRVFDEDHVDALPRERKRSGAFCATVNTRMTPYLFLNHTDDHQSVKTLAHEMGHAVHSMLAEDRHPLVSHAGLCLAETASVFSEMLLHDHLVDQADEEERVRLVSDKLGEIYATVMRQAWFAMFEIEAHDRIRGGATTQEVHELYLSQLREQFGPVEVPEKWKYEWTYIPHFYASPFYVYAYSFGMLLSLSLYERYREEGPDFVGPYKQLLGAGGSVSPQPLLERTMEEDITDRGFWERGFDVVEDMARELGVR